MGTHVFFVFFLKEKHFSDFLFASLSDLTLPKRDLLLKEAILLQREVNTFFLR